MASSSSFVDSQEKYDVFLSFRGEDTRRTFTSHLFAALCRNKIKTFIDDGEIKKGDELSPTLLAAIESSKISIIIFSMNYASSKWCLDELQKIIECKKRKEHVVIPVFYDINPSHVRYQKGTFEVAFAKHQERFKDNLIKVQEWRKALREAANLSGRDSLNFRLDSELVEVIVGDVLHKLNHMYPLVSRGLVGIDEQIKSVESLLCLGSADVRIIGIWGMGGIGKTTIADALRTKLSKPSYQYEGCYFVAKVMNEWKHHRENVLRDNLLTEILGDSNLSFSSPSMGSTFVKHRLQSKKLLIILDDVSDLKQIEYLIGGKDWYGLGTRIILTTRNKEVLNKEVDGVYQVRQLNSIEALKLFSLNAFQQERPLREYSHLSEMAVDYAKGIPLALKVLGSYLSSKQPKVWEEMLEKLKKIPKAEINDVLKLSYEGLDIEEQSVFLDIACCFKGDTKCHITSLLDGCGFSTEIAIRSLQDKALITVSKDQKVQMHDLLQEMGWQIVREESKYVESRSRLWNPNEIYDILKFNKGTDSIESMVLDMSQIKDVTLSPQTFNRMNKLRFLIFHMPSCNKRSNVHIPRGLECMPNELRFLRWDFFPLKFLPPSFCAEELVELDLKHSLIEKLWDEMQDLVNLKSLYLSSCRNLIELPDLTLASKLEDLHLDDCASLVHVPSSILLLDSLLALNLRGCKQLCYLESEKQSRSLRWLNLRGCSRLVKFSVSSEKIEYLILDGTAMKEFPSSVAQLLKLPPTFDTPFHLTTVSMDCCSNLSKLPDNLGLFSTLNKLTLRGSSIENLPSSITFLSMLRALDVSNCRRLRSLPELPVLLQNLNASNCVSLETVSDFGNSLWGLNGLSIRKKIQEEEKKSIRHRDYFGRFEYYNCIKLDQIARETVVKEALIRINLAASLTSKVGHPLGSEVRPVYVVLPGSEVPKWFEHTETQSSIITLRFTTVGRWRCDHNLAFCLVLGPSHSAKERNQNATIVAGCRYYTRHNIYRGTCVINSYCNGAESDQELPSNTVEFEHCVAASGKDQMKKVVAEPHEGPVINEEGSTHNRPVIRYKTVKRIRPRRSCVRNHVNIN